MQEPAGSNSSGLFWMLSTLGQKWIHHLERLFYQLAVLQILGVKRFAAALKRGGHDERIKLGEAVALGNLRCF